VSKNSKRKDGWDPVFDSGIKAYDESM